MARVPKSDFVKKAIMELKGEGAYEINFASVNWKGGQIAIEIHCDAGQILTKTESRAKIGICGFSRKQNSEQTKMENFSRELRFRG